MRYTETTSRTLELLLVIVGGFISLIASLYLIFGGILTDGVEIGLSVISIIGSLLAIYLVFYIEKYEEKVGPLLIIATIMILFGFSAWDILGAILVLIAGISVMFRK